MSVVSLVTNDMPVVHSTDSVRKALDLMEDGGYDALPVVDEEQYVCLVKESDMLEMDDETLLSDIGVLSNFRPAIPMSVHPFEAIKVQGQIQLAILPVLDSENKYNGVVTGEALLRYMSDQSGITGPGGILVLEMTPINYSLVQIARICENEDITVLHSQIFTTPDGMLEVTLKTNKTSLDALANSFDRHGINVKEVYGDQRHMEDLMDKYHLLMTYLNM